MDLKKSCFHLLINMMMIRVILVCPLLLGPPSTTTDWGPWACYSQSDLCSGPQTSFRQQPFSEPCCPAWALLLLGSSGLSFSESRPLLLARRHCRLCSGQQPFSEPCCLAGESKAKHTFFLFQSGRARLGVPNVRSFGPAHMHQIALG